MKKLLLKVLATSLSLFLKLPDSVAIFMFRNLSVSPVVEQFLCILPRMDLSRERTGIQILLLQS